MSHPNLRIVSAAIIRENGKVLACQRPAGDPLAGYWEFPGGKVEPGEDPRAALQRELIEELAIETEVGEPFEIIFHEYESGPILLLFFETTITAGDLRPLFHSDVRWVVANELTDLDFLPADRDMIRTMARIKPRN